MGSSITQEAALPTKGELDSQSAKKATSHYRRDQENPVPQKKGPLFFREKDGRRKDRIGHDSQKNHFNSHLDSNSKEEMELS